MNGPEPDPFTAIRTLPKPFSIFHHQRSRTSIRHQREVVLSKKRAAMAKKKLFVRLVSAAGTGFFYVKPKNPRKTPEKLEFRKYDPRVNKHVLFTEQKMK